jgi:hypothetical protein
MLRDEGLIFSCSGSSSGSEVEEEEEGEVSRFAGVGEDASFSDGELDMRERFGTRESGSVSAGRFEALGFNLVIFPEGWACNV